MRSERSVLELRNGATIESAKTMVETFDDIVGYQIVIYFCMRAIDEARKDGYANARKAEDLLDRATREAQLITDKKVTS